MNHLIHRAILGSAAIALALSNPSVATVPSSVRFASPPHVASETGIAGQNKPQLDLLTLFPPFRNRSDTGANVGSLTNPYEGDAEAIREGAKLYEKMNCYGCHGRDGGGGMGPTLREPSHWKYGRSDGDLFETVRRGRPRMPGFEKHLTVPETWKLISFVRTFARAHESKSLFGSQGSMSRKIADQRSENESTSGHPRDKDHTAGLREYPGLKKHRYSAKGEAITGRLSRFLRGPKPANRRHRPRRGRH